MARSSVESLPSSSRGESATEAIRVVCRVRPRFRDLSDPGHLVFGADGRGVCVDDLSTNRRNFMYDAVFGESASQFSIYESLGHPMVEAALNGINCSILAYGQTGAGKTHTMTGTMSDVAHRGIVPRLVDELFRRIHDAQHERAYNVRSKYVQVYNEKVYDLLDPNQDYNRPLKLQQFADPDAGWHIPQLRGHPVSTAEEVNGLMDQGIRNRRVAETNMNAQSSRSHCIFILDVSRQVTESIGAYEKTATIFLVDLAGSESVDRTGATGNVLNEAKYINKSLLSLRSVIKALVEKQRPVYRDSVLTKLLRNSIGGNSRTALIVCISPEKADVRDTVSTLNFGQMTTNVRTVVRENIFYSSEVLQEMLGAAQAALLEAREKLRRLKNRAKKNGMLNRDVMQRIVRKEERQQALFARHEDLIPFYKCPLSGVVFENAIVCETGVTYERAALLTYYHQNHKLPPPMGSTMPVHPTKLINGTLAVLPNYNLLDQVRLLPKGEPLTPLTARRKPFELPHRRFPLVRGSGGRADAVDMPADCIILICSFLDSFKDLQNMSRVCSRWEWPACEDVLWAVFIRSEFGPEGVEGRPEAIPCRDHFFRLLKEKGEAVAAPSFKTGTGFALFRPR